ncbi:unnamed protein product [Callosobruchus maculatus]|uniref:Uncharacterized protein n=1 Tax=Callosobruchus maculatus TaxID=64391 RepID=A0A653BYA4_CALMS|nr:unnamed protein product [Callosobruchus maculatus]
MFPETFHLRSFISALSAFVNLAANRCYKIRMSFCYVIIQLLVYF